LPEGARCTHLINYDLPRSGREYVRRVASFAGPPRKSQDPCICYTFVEQAELKSRRCRELVGVLRRAKEASSTRRKATELCLKAVELESALHQLSPEENDLCQDESGDGDDDECDQCDCIHCCGQGIAKVSYHGAPGAPQGTRRRYLPQVEVVHIHLRALEAEGEAWESLVALTAPKLGHACTIVALHAFMCHTAWDGCEHYFAALPPGAGTVRVILVLADEGSWHDYPDWGTFAGGVAWVDILDMSSMNRTDRLLEKLVDHEVSLLGGESERLVLMGSSQGGVQSMLRFLRSRHRLGGFLGAVCHVPTAPHTSCGSDPLADKFRPTVNLDRPMRFLAGALDSTFTLPLVRRDVARLKEVGGFTNVEMEVLPDHQHEGPREEKEAEENGDAYTKGPPVELLYLQRWLPSMVPTRPMKLAKCGRRRACWPGQSDSAPSSQESFADPSKEQPMSQ
jgi:hypothetical protein